MRPPFLAWWRGGCLVAGAFVLASMWAACASDPPPKKEPPRCAQFKRGTDVVEKEVLCAQKDSDGDGVDDAVDLCPKAKEIQNGEADGDGCPDPDQDFDLLLDFEDACPEQPGPMPDGCPLADSDGDGIPDHLDGCPKKPEDIDGEDDADGCPEGARLLRSHETLTVWRDVKIEQRRGKAALSEEGARTLAALVDEAAERTAVIVQVSVLASAGLQEARRKRARRAGRAQPAQELAARRAEKVRSAFVTVGIPPSRIAVEVKVLSGSQTRDTGTVQITVKVATSADPDTLNGAEHPMPTDGGS